MKALSYILLFVFQLSIFKPIWVIVDYQANYEYITEVLCENKERPELNCNGTCYLHKELSKIAKDEMPTEDSKPSASMNRTKSEYIPMSDYAVDFSSIERKEKVRFDAFVDNFLPWTPSIDSPPPQWV